MTARSLDADRQRRRGLLRPADPAGGARRRPRGRRAGLRRQAAGRALGAAGGDRRAADRGGTGRQERRPPEGRRPVRLRPRRRGGRSAARGRGRVRGRARESPPASPPPPTPASPSPTATTPPRSPSSPATRTRRRPRRRSTGTRSPRFPGTLVFYMGVKRLAENAAALIAGGPRRRASRRRRSNAAPGPASAPSSRRWGRSPRRSSARASRRPALIVVGAVAARREELAWLERRPLHGRRVVVTRARAQASGLAATLRDLGAEVVELPAIRIEPRIESEEVRARGRGDRRVRARSA